MGLAVALDRKPIFIAYNGSDNKKTEVPPAGRDTEKETADQQDCLIKGKPDLYQSMDRDESGWEMSNWPNGGVFNCLWKPQNVSFSNGIMTIKLTRDSSGSYAYDSGEYRTSAEKYSYGYYEVRMKTAKGAGLVAGFFTYKGVFGEKSHNEIDFEVLLKDPTKVQLNYYYAGTGKNDKHVKLIDLGFDASQGFHNYGFIWKKGSIEWFIDGKSVYKATEDIPQDPCRIEVSFWPGTRELSGWLGGVYNGNGGQVQYDWIKYKSLR